MKLYQEYLEEYQKGLMAYAPLAIIGQSCLGSVAVMAILVNGNSLGQMTQLCIVIILSMIYNGAILAQQKAVISFNVLIISVTTSLIFIAANTL